MGQGELGHVGDNPDSAEGSSHINPADFYTDPKMAKDFVDKTGVDALAIAVGTAHGAYKLPPKLDFERIHTIANTVDVPLVLHGGSGLTDNDFKRAIQEGISKINIFTDINVAAVEAEFRKFETMNKGIIDLIPAAVEAVKQETLKKMEESQDTTKEAMAEQQKVVSELSTTVEKGEVSYQKAESRVQDWKKSLNNAEAQTITATRALNENSAYMQEAEKSADGCATSIDAFGKQVNVAAEATDNLNTSVNKIFVTEKIGEIADNISGKMRDLASSAYDATKELDEGYDTIVTKTGATGKALDMALAYALGIGGARAGVLETTFRTEK